MTVTAATLEHLARDSATNADPEEALRALTALRRELSELESELVGRAVQSGASWSQVAKSLGISRQAAHRKHRHAVEGALDAATTGGPRILVTGEARRSIQLARDEARRLGQRAIGTEHILLGILRCSNSHAVRALNGLGIDLEQARAAVVPTLVDEDSSETRANGDVTPHGRRILEGSMREAVKRREGYIGVEHLLLALLTDRRNGAVQTLKQLGATPAQIRTRVDREWSRASEV